MSSDDEPTHHGGGVALLGRHVVTAELAAGWQRTQAGGGQVVVVVADAAMGKSSLLRWLRAHIGPDGGTVVEVVGRGGDLARPLSSLGELLGRLPDADPFVARLDAVDEVDPIVAGHVLREALESAARLRPLVVLVDDVHDMDPASRTAVNLALRGAVAPCLLAVAAGRPTDAVMAFAEGFRTLRVEGLEDADARRLLLASASTQVADAVLVRLLEVSQGNPLALRSLPDHLEPGHLDGTQLLPEPIPVAGDLRDAFERPLASLTPPARELIELAAVSADGSMAVIGAAVPGSIDELVAEVEAAGLGHLDDGRLVFTHPLVRSAAVVAMSRRRRRELNGRLAEVAQIPVETRLLHRAHSILGPDEVLVDALEDAARRQRARGGAEGAARLLERAVALSGDADRCQRMRIDSADVLAVSGSHLAARRQLETVHDGPEDRVGAARWRAMASIRLARIEALNGDPLGAWQRLRECVAVAPEAEVGVVHSTMAVPLGMLGLVREIEVQAALAIEHTEPGTVPRHVADVVHAHAVGATAEGRGRHLVEALPEIDLLDALDHDPQLGLHLGRSFGLAERIDDGVEALTALAARGRGERARASLAMTYGTLGELHVRGCRYDEAIANLDEALVLSLATGQRAFAPFWFALRARVRSVRGDHDGAKADLDAGLGIADELTLLGARYFLLGAAGMDALTRDAPAEAVGFLEECRFFENAGGVLSPNLGRWRPDLVSAHLARGDDDLASEVLGPLTDAAAAPGASRWTRGSAAWSAGLVAARRDPVAGDRLLQEAVEILDPVADCFDRARALLDLARLRSRRGTAASEEVAAEARYAFRRLGSVPWEDKVAVHRRADGAGGIAELSPAELRVLSAVSRGATNQQIAVQLGVSPKTVANHLSAIYRKLSVSSRTEAAHRYLDR
ncbi:helix-turn-helix transcriptional regulator [Rhabdothermincola salaria]|uniref:helix-turn-helix transcriptional regulator n=1 Tax=Rhabdothermincola salaria TaxID=2903142 RepID=UPI001E2D2A42|nr:LuxR family transcriptional regulator [Rhabdothermincola salaria]MCD9624499.1 LuxR C-terminal-related transcriptional regulator [Rhabdothermincola salaria]